MDIGHYKKLFIPEFMWILGNDRGGKFSPNWIKYIIDTLPYIDTFPSLQTPHDKNLMKINYKEEYRVMGNIEYILIFMSSSMFRFVRLGLYWNYRTAICRRTFTKLHKTFPPRKFQNVLDWEFAWISRIHPLVIHSHYL